MRDIFDGTTKAAHATFELKFDRAHPLTTNDLALTERMVPTLQRVVGKENVGVAPPETGSEDFSFFSNIVPGFYFRIGVVPRGEGVGRPPHADVLRRRQGGADWHSSPEHARARLPGLRHALTLLLLFLFIEKLFERLS